MLNLKFYEGAKPGKAVAPKRKITDDEHIEKRRQLRQDGLARHGVSVGLG